MAQQVLHYALFRQGMLAITGAPPRPQVERERRPLLRLADKRDPSYRT